MKFFATASLALCVAAWAGAPADAQAQGKLCDKPRQMEGFKTCANIEKAEAEGAFTLYSTDPEQGQVKLLASFNKMFPKIKTSYVRLQAGAQVDLYTALILAGDVRRVRGATLGHVSATFASEKKRQRDAAYT